MPSNGVVEESENFVCPKDLLGNIISPGVVA